MEAMIFSIPADQVRVTAALIILRDKVKIPIKWVFDFHPMDNGRIRIAIREVTMC